VGWWLEDENKFLHHNYFEEKDIHWHIPMDPALECRRAQTVLGRHQKPRLTLLGRAEINEK
jgi:hypothetical protein